MVDQEVVVGAPYLANGDGSTGAIFVYKADISRLGLMAGMMCSRKKDKEMYQCHLID